MAKRPVPRGFHNVTPHLIVRDAAEAIGFYNRAFDAAERLRLEEPDGRIAHAEIVIGDSPVMVSDESPAVAGSAPRAPAGSPVAIHLYVEHVDAVARRAVDLGAEVLIPVSDQFYGDRAGRLRDPFGHVWVVATHIEDVEPAEMRRRFAALLQPDGKEARP